MNFGEAFEFWKNIYTFDNVKCLIKQRKGKHTKIISERDLERLAQPKVRAPRDNSFVYG